MNGKSASDLKNKPPRYEKTPVKHTNTRFKAVNGKEHTNKLAKQRAKRALSRPHELSLIHI